ncbi:MAG: hypothetical protein LBB08_02245 [Rickettsiales bacterium]|jgi:hypothetical protein|nr:hypothetical protein [Rickettsiales bacterium]
MRLKHGLLQTALCIILAGCLQTDQAAYNEADFQEGGPDAPELNERTMAFMQPGNPYSNVEAFRPKTGKELDEAAEKWNASRMETHWQEYRGQMVRVQVILGDSDLREMRLKLVQNANGGDVDGDIRSVLGKVADFEMKKVCGRRAETIAIVYDKASFDTVRPTPFFDHKIETEGAVMREYGFRCVYRG